MMKIMKEDMREFLRKLLYWVMLFLYIYAGLLIQYRVYTNTFGIREAIATILYYWLVAYTDWDYCLEVMFK